MQNNIVRDDLDAVIAFLQGAPILTQSSQVKAFEEEWSRWLGVKYSVMVNSGSSANQVTLGIVRELHGLGEVITPTLTWVSDVAAVIQHGFTPIFVDINFRTLGMDTSQVLERLGERTRCVFITHILGYNALDQKLLDECHRLGIPLIEDVCESHGATFRNKKLGTHGWISNFSFYYAHHLSTIEGGMICTDDPEVYEYARLFRSHGMVRESTSLVWRDSYYKAFPDLNPDFIFAFPAYNVRSTEINAVIGRSQLPRLDGNNLKRQRNLRIFLENLDPETYYTDFDTEGACNYALTLVLRHPNQKLRERIENELRFRRIEFRRGTSGGGNQLRQPYLRKLYPHIDPSQFANVDHVHFFGYYIGNYPDIEEERVLKLCELLNELSYNDRSAR